MELDYEQWKLVKEALHERRIFLQTAPYLSAMLPIMLPIYKYVFSADIRADPYDRRRCPDIGKSRTTGQDASFTMSWPERRTWNLRIL